MVPIDLANGEAGTTIGVPGAIAIAIAPNGSTAYVVTGQKDTLTSIDLVDHKIGKVIPLPKPKVGGPTSYLGIAVAPDGQTAYVVDGSGGLFPVDLMTNSVGTPIEVPLGTGGPIVVTPDGHTAYLITGTGGSVGNEPDVTDLATIDLTTGTTSDPIDVLNDAIDLGISPDGRTVYVTTGTGPPSPRSFVVPLEVATNKPGTAKHFSGGSLTVAVAPGRRG